MDFDKVDPIGIFEEWDGWREGQLAFQEMTEKVKAADNIIASMQKTTDSQVAENAKLLAELNSLKMQLANLKTAKQSGKRKMGRFDDRQQTPNSPRIGNPNSDSTTNANSAASTSNTAGGASTGNSGGMTHTGFRTVTTKAQQKREKASAETARNRDKPKVIQLKKINSTQLGDRKLPLIICKDDLIMAQIIDLLKAANIPFQTYDNEESCPKAFLVRGLSYPSHQDAIDAIKATITALGVSGTIDVSHFETDHLRQNPDRLPLYRVVVGSTVSGRLLVNIRTIGNFSVRVEKMKKPLFFQCHKCQRFHHMTKQCRFGYRCVQCTAPHARGKCPRTENIALPAECVNCLRAKLDHSGHAANDLKNCALFKKMVEATNACRNIRAAAEEMGKLTNTTWPATRGANDNRPPDGISADQLAKIIATTVQSVLSSIAGGL